MKHKAEIVLRALLKGHGVPYQGRKAYLEDDVLLTNFGAHHTIAVDPSLKEFIDECENTPDESIAEIAMNLALNKS